MAYYVSSLVLLQSSKCPSAFSCLKKGECANPARCQVADGRNDSILFLENTESLETCPYRLSMGSRQFCVCPTLIALYKQKNDTENEEMCGVG